MSLLAKKSLNYTTYWRVSRTLLGDVDIDVSDPLWTQEDIFDVGIHMDDFDEARDECWSLIQCTDNQVALSVIRNVGLPSAAWRALKISSPRLPLGN